MKDIPGQGTALESQEAACCVCPQTHTVQMGGAEGTRRPWDLALGGAGWQEDPAGP